MAHGLETEGAKVRYAILMKRAKPALLAECLQLNPFGGYNSRTPKDILIRTIMAWEQSDD